MTEVWKPIKGYEDCYQISDQGHVRSIVKTTSRRIGILKPHLKNGYLAINLFKDKTVKHFYIHRLVAEAFIPNPDDLPEVNHIDADKTNNDVSNLEWCTRNGNLKHAWDLGHKCTGESHGCAKLTEEDVRTIRDLRGKMTTKELGEMFDIARCTVSAIQLHRIWKGVV